MDITSYIKEIEQALLQDKEKIFLRFCNFCIEEKEKGRATEEEAGYAVCGIGHAVSADFSADIENIIDHACDMEIPREMSHGAGINIGDTWTQEIADGYKAGQWKEFVALVGKIK